MVGALDKLAEYESFCDDILPILRRAIKEKWSKEKIQSDPTIQAILVAKQITVAVTERDSAKALAAIKDVRDREEGKAVERREVKHQLQDLPDEQLDALLQSKLKEADEDEILPN